MNVIPKIQGYLRVSDEGVSQRAKPRVIHFANHSSPYNLIFELTEPFEYRPNLFCNFVEVNMWYLWPPSSVKYPKESTPTGMVIQAFPVKEILYSSKNDPKAFSYAEYARLDILPEWEYIERAEVLPDGSNKDPQWRREGLHPVLKRWGMDFHNFDSFDSTTR